MGVYRGNVTITNPNMGGVGLNSWHVRTAPLAGDDNELLNDASQAIKTFYNDISATVFASDSTIRHDGDWAEVNGDQGYETVDPWSADVFSAGTPFPAHLAIVAGWGTNVRNRTGYGRTFLGPLRGQSQDDRGTPTDAVLTDIRAAMDALIAESGPQNNWAICVYSRKLQLARDITSRTVHDQFAVLRSRRL